MDAIPMEPEQPAGMLGSDEINRRLGYHPATVATIPLHEEARARFVELACWLDTALPPGRDLAETHTLLQHTLWAANATIACNLAPLEDPAGRVPNPLVEQMTHNRVMQTLQVDLRIPDGMEPAELGRLLAAQLMEQLQRRSVAEQSTPRPRVQDAPQA